MSQETTNNAWLKLIYETMTKGKTVEVRGSTIKELLNPSITVDPLWPFITFEARNYNIDYCKMELQWKINAGRFDDRIEKHAKMWSQVKNDDGSFNSNYGVYWFAKGGVKTAVLQLVNDRHTRRASIPMLSADHVEMHIRDSVCTEAMTFLIRDDKLHCFVHMRSSDQVFGLGTDIPSFSLVQRLVLALISDEYPEVTMGNLTITAASSHIYERHFDMCEQLIGDNPKLRPMCNDFWMPIPDKDEADYLIHRTHLNIGYVDYNQPLCMWLISGGVL